MTQDNPHGNGKLNQLIEKFGGWAAITMIGMAAWFYNTGQAENLRRYDSVVAITTEHTRAISRLQDSKASRAELKELQESFLRETQGLRQDFKEGFSILRADISVRREYTLNK